MRRIVAYGPGGYDPTKPNNNVVRDDPMPEAAWIPIYPGSVAGTVTWRLLGDPEPVIRLTCDQGIAPDTSCLVVPLSLTDVVRSTTDTPTIVAALGPQLAQVFAAAASLDQGLCPIHDRPTNGDSVDLRLATLPPGALQAIVQSVMTSRIP